MKQIADLLITNIGQLCTLATDYRDGRYQPKRGEDLNDVGLILDAAIAVQNGKIAAVGSREEIHDSYRSVNLINVEGLCVTPGLVDPHTHLVWGGDRADEFELRARGMTYQEVMARGGGINRTVRLTRDAGLSSLLDQAQNRLDRMLAHGSTTVEAKTGYGLDLSTEITLLNTVALLDVDHPIDLIPTYLGAHAVPPDHGSADDYVRMICDIAIPAIAAWRGEHWPRELYCDVFCENGAFNLEQTHYIFQAAAAAGLPLKVHADEFASLGATALAVEMGARSADHLLVTRQDDVERLGGSDTVAVLMPGTPFGLNIPNTAPAKALIAAGAIVALGTDCNPGTSWCESMQTVLSLAVRALGMSQAQALACATINAAYAIDRADEVGSVQSGKLADLVVWDAPTYQHLGYRFGANLARYVIKGGELAWRA